MSHFFAARSVLNYKIYKYRTRKNTIAHQRRDCLSPKGHDRLKYEISYGCGAVMRILCLYGVFYRVCTCVRSTPPSGSRSTTCEQRLTEITLLAINKFLSESKVGSLSAIM